LGFPGRIRSHEVDEREPGADRDLEYRLAVLDARQLEATATRPSLQSGPEVVDGRDPCVDGPDVERAGAGRSRGHVLSSELNAGGAPGPSRSRSSRPGYESARGASSLAHAASSQTGSHRARASAVSMPLGRRPWPSLPGPRRIIVQVLPRLCWR